MFDGLEKALFFLPQNVHDAGLRSDQFGVGLAHHRHQVGHDAVEEGGAHAELVAVTNRAADDAAQHVAAAFVAGDDAIDDQEGTGADVVGDDLERVVGQIGRLRFACGGGDQRLEQVDLVVGMHVLHHRRNALQPHAGVDRRLGQRMHRAGLVAVELHEHVVPDFDVAVAVFVGRAGWAAGDLRRRGRRRFRCRGRTDRCRPSPRSCRRRSAHPCCRQCGRCALSARRCRCARCRRLRRPRRTP